MLSFFAEYGLFLAKTITIIVATLFAIANFVSLATRHRKTDDRQLEITHLNKQFEEMEQTLVAATLSDAGLKAYMKQRQKKTKQEAKAEKKASKTTRRTPTKDTPETPHKRVFVLDFDGDIKASSVEMMRQEISALLTIATPDDEILVRLESGGGTVHGYGFGASQLQRIRQQAIPLTVAVDKVAASGGYLMACVANKVIAAPFAIIGSIGVLAQIPNLHRLLKKNDVDYEQLYAGEYKRTLTLFGENTEKARNKVQQELEETHQLFKDFVHSQRPQLAIDKVATGEYWLGTRAQELGLVDELKTSDDYLMAMRAEADLLQIKYTQKQTVFERLSNMMTSQIHRQQKTLHELQRPLFM